jgi:hypothetical protein
VKAQHEQGKAIQAKSKSDAAWQEYNAKIAEREAVEKQTAAGAEESKFRKAAERKKARLRTQIGKAGILPIGSVELVAEENARELEIDALNIRRSGTVGAQALTASAQLSRLSGRSALLRGKAARRAGRTGAIATGLSGASQLTFAATA